MRCASWILLCAAGFAARDERKVELPHDWKPGTSYHVELTKIREDLEEGKLVARHSSRSPIDVEVLQRRQDGYTLRWTHGRPETQTDVRISGALVDRISGLVEGLRVDVLADASGSVTGPADVAAMERHFDLAGRALLEEIRGKNALDSAQLETLTRSLSELKGASLVTSYLQAPRLFYLPSGSSLTVGERREYEDVLPNPFGGDPLPSRASLTLTRLDPVAHEAVVDWRQVIDPDRAGPILEASIRAFVKRTGQELPQEASLTFDAIEDAATWVYDVTTGIPKSVVMTRATSMAGRRRIDTTEMRVSSFATK